MRALALFSALGFAVAACSTTPPAPDPNACRTIASRCHPYDTGSGIGHDCHEVGHDGTAAQCTAKRDECLAACPPIEAGANDGGADAVADATNEADAPSDPCPAFCACMEATCKPVAGYPYAMPSDCTAACKKLTAPELACFPNWCEQAKTATTMKDHLCEHAWGAFGLDEC